MKDGDISKSDDNRITTSEDKKYSLMVITYYFHRTMRCPSCREIEANAAKVIAADFKQQLADGKLTWMPFNLDDKGGEELEKEFNISGSTLVLAKVKDGKHTEYKKLEKVWQLMHDSGAFNAYVRDETRRFLSE